MSLKIAALTEVLSHLTLDEEKQLAKFINENYPPICICFTNILDDHIECSNVAYSDKHVNIAIYDLFVSMFCSRFAINRWKFTISVDETNHDKTVYTGNRVFLLGPTDIEEIRKYEFKIDTIYIIEGKVEERVHVCCKLELDKIQLVT
jgi:hypothetical protein